MQLRPAKSLTHKTYEIAMYLNTFSNVVFPGTYPLLGRTRHVDTDMDDGEAINLVTIRMAHANFPWKIPIAVNVLPLFVCWFINSYFHDFGMYRLCCLFAWHAFVATIALSPRFFRYEFLRVLISIVVGVYCSYQLPNIFCRAVYVLATLMYLVGRGTALANNAFLGNMTASYRLTYIVNILDISKAVQIKTESEFLKRRHSLWKHFLVSLILNISSCVVLIAVVPELPPIVNPLIRYIGGCVCFTSALYITDAFYQSLFFIFAESREQCLRVKPLMIRPWV